MATVNITIENRTWQDIETLGEVTFTQNQVYTIAGRGAGSCEVAVAETKPDETLLGHIVKGDENFGFTFTGDKIWVRSGEPVKVVLT